MPQLTDPWESHPNFFLSFMGRDLPASSLLDQALARKLPHLRSSIDRQPSHDYAQIDPSLPVILDATTPPPSMNTGYAGMTSAQRGFFYRWTINPTAAAAAAYQRLYLAHMEMALLREDLAQSARKHLLDLMTSQGWDANIELARTALLAGWLAQDGRYLAQVIADGHFSAALMGVGLGWQALLAFPLHAAESINAHRIWQTRGALAPSPLPEAEIVQLNIDSLRATLGADPLRYALNRLMDTHPVQEGETPTSDSLLDQWRGPWEAWRSAHRDLQICLPQPNLRSYLSPLLTELLQHSHPAPPFPVVPQAEEEEESADEEDGVDAATPNWYLVLEFSESRSQFYDYVVFQAQKQPNYRMLMDENRQIVHRLLYQKRQMRQFWRLWDYVQNWSSTKVYLNGQELEKWKIWPYSQYLRG
ncbi:MAG: hypothetical protein KF893_26725 [Caldilineaceae bacterium]|nr:hypothetical protein [Caldilineaceae bacterium]